MGECMKKVIEANQRLPYKLMKNKFLHRQQYKELLHIVNKNIPDISEKEIIELFKNLSDSGCSSAMLANVLVNQIYDNDESFRNIFGFSLLSKDQDKIDCNKLMVDIYSKLYGVMKARFIEYDYYSFDSIEEAAFKLLGQNYDTKDATIALFDNGIKPEGFDSNGKLLFGNTVKPKITNHIGNCSQIAKEKFGIDGIKSLDQLKRICTEKNIIFEYSQLEIAKKFNGLQTESFNFWSNYYLQKYNIDFYLDETEIIIKDFNGNYNEFMTYISQLISDNYSVIVSSPPGSIAYMHTDKSMSWGNISSDSAAHVMTVKGFNDEKDIVVSSYGIDYIIPKDYFQILSFKKIKKFHIEKNNKFNEQKMSR